MKGNEIKVCNTCATKHLWGYFYYSCDCDGLCDICKFNLISASFVLNDSDYLWINKYMRIMGNCPEYLKNEN